MKSFVAQLALAAALVLAAAVIWSAGTAEQELAAAERSLATLRYDRAAQELQAASEGQPLRRLLRGVAADPATAVHEQRTASYWRGDYDDVSKLEDPGLRLLAANAAFRAMRRNGGSRQTVLNRTDDLAKRYAEIVRQEPDNEDAAFNYEFVLRFRNAVASTKQPNLDGADPAATGVTVHGIPGGPPENSDAKKFRMIIPMRPDERMEAEEAGRGQTRIRKG